MRHYFIILLLLAFNLCNAQTRLDTMINELKQADFANILLVKDSIVNYQKDAIPKLIVLLKDTSYLKLKNTADLNYPGADEIYGHGQYVNYDLDWVSIRAAWLLEEITFQNFGFSEFLIQDTLFNRKQFYNSEYYKKNLQSNLSNKLSRELLKNSRLILADSVIEWWNKNKNSWTRYYALKEALSSTNEYRQSLSLYYLRFGETYCDGLTLSNYKKELKPLIEKIRKSNLREAENAKYLLDDTEYYWFKLKPQKRGK